MSERDRTHERIARAIWRCFYDFGEPYWMVPPGDRIADDQRFRCETAADAVLAIVDGEGGDK